MFDSISPRYDFLNHILSMGIDVGWRKKALSQLKDTRPERILDVATGTGDFAIQALTLKPAKVTGIDISNGMLDVGKEKVKKKNLEHKIELMYGDSEHMPFEDNSFDAVTVAFGVRNFEHLDMGLKEMHRVIRPGGKAVVLEFSNPKRFPVKQIFGLYCNTIMPWIGKKVSRHATAYSYLPKSVREFPEGQAFLDVLSNAGFRSVKRIPVTFGIATIYLGEKH
ncbi:MAG: bifunctional demethylmenaquinone methyltransferase/2-methoxy-6-polyprenyl-1,4-benzoquinol methylase UbiE [Flavobacteriales bacterium]|nr:bifunctional demethylmenaquinone methyltransferase/2-methoxy-6-polyprenyl-1,4-benzoquinol methylase UbiE [Flavobacteriales bacterium]